MRFLFCASPSLGHIFPIIPTSSALRMAGHDVLFAAYGNTSLYENSGAPVVSVGDGSTLAEMFERHAPGRRFGIPERSTEAMLRMGAAGHGELSRKTIEPLIGLTNSWSPDVLVYEPFQSAVPIVAGITGIPAVEHEFGILSGRLITRIFSERLADEYRHYKIDGPPSVARIEVTPPSLRPIDPRSWQMRYIPYSGSGLIPIELIFPSPRPRILVTLGTVLIQNSGLDSLKHLIQVAGKVDAEFLLALGPNVDVSPLGVLPVNMCLLPWMPLSEVLRTCDAVVHHGGSGTMMAGVAHGIPQLLLPQGADNFLNAEAAVRSGYGLRADPENVDAPLLAHLLNDVSLRDAAAEIRAETEARPSPVQIVERLAGMRRETRPTGE